jgi:hypothetical protein
MLRTPGGPLALAPVLEQLSRREIVDADRCAHGLARLAKLRAIVRRQPPALRRARVRAAF